MNIKKSPCPLCNQQHASLYQRDKQREYLQCSLCKLVFVEPEFQLSHEAERAQYDFHQNTPDDPGYRRFLDRLAVPLLQRLPPKGRGLDFGCGPGPTLSVMLEEQGHKVSLFDIYYVNDPQVLEARYQFITATEVIEHLSEPGRVLTQLWNLLLPGGWLGLMTKQVTTPDSFSRWHYKQDPTHISFFSRESFNWLGEQWGSLPQFIGEDVILYQRESKG